MNVGTANAVKVMLAIVDGEQIHVICKLEDHHRTSKLRSVYGPVDIDPSSTTLQ